MGYWKWSRLPPWAGFALGLGASGCGHSEGVVVEASRSESRQAGSPVTAEAKSAGDNGYTRQAVQAFAGQVATYRSNGRYSDRFPNILLQTHEGRSVRFYDDLVKDRTVIINFMYTVCDGI